MFIDYSNPSYLMKNPEQMSKEWWIEFLSTDFPKKKFDSDDADSFKSMLNTIAKEYGNWNEDKTPNGFSDIYNNKIITGLTDASSLSKTKQFLNQIESELRSSGATNTADILRGYIDKVWIISSGSNGSSSGSKDTPDTKTQSSIDWASVGLVGFAVLLPLGIYMYRKRK